MRQYTVKAGDTLGKIANRHDVTLDAIIQTNRLRNPDRISPGQVISIPEVTTDAMDAVAVPIEAPPERFDADTLRINRTRYRLPAKEYYPVVTPKDLIVLHFTAGQSAKSAYQTWADNPTHVATAYIVDTDGSIFETFDPSYWAYHLGVKNTRGKHDKRSIGIEIANVGPLKLDPDRSRLNWWPRDWKTKWCSLDQTERYVRSSYRGIDYFATMPDAQLQSVGGLVRFLCDSFAIRRRIPGVRRRNEFDAAFFDRWTGVAAHQNFRNDKWDVGPAFDWERLGF